MFGQERRGPAGIAAELGGPRDRCRAEAVANGVEHGIESRAVVPVDRQFGLDAVGSPQLRERDADECDAAFGDLRAGRSKEALGDGEQGGCAVGRVAEGARPGGSGEVAEAEPQHDGAAGAVAVAQPASEPIDDLGEDEVEFFGRSRAVSEGALRADGSASPRGVDRARIP